jgi:pyrroline-5-carboxylate reductase
MLDVRTKDALRAMPNTLAAIGESIRELKEDSKVIKGLLRDIKKSLVRKYGKGEEESQEEVTNA